MRVTKKDKINQVARWIWPDAEPTLCNTVAGGHYHIGIVSEYGSVIKQLTPCYKTPAELLAYLEGVHAAISNPTITKII